MFENISNRDGHLSQSQASQEDQSQSQSQVPGFVSRDKNPMGFKSHCPSLISNESPEKRSLINLLESYLISIFIFNLESEQHSLWVFVVFSSNKVLQHKNEVDFVKVPYYSQDTFQIIIEIEISEAFPEAVFYDCASRERDLVLSLTNLAKQRRWANFVFETVRFLVDMKERQRASSTPQTWLIKLCTLPYVDSKIIFVKFFSPTVSVVNNYI